jgi:hypothetical protein
MERVRAWDDHLQAQRDKEAAKEAAKVERRRLQFLEEVYAGAQGCLERAKALGKFPVATKSLSQDGKTIVIRPGLMVGREMAALFMKAAELGKAYFDAMARDPNQMSDAEIEAVANVGMGLDG